MIEGEERKKLSFMALRTPAASEVRYFEENKAGSFQISFVDFLQERPLQLKMTEVAMPGEIDFHIQSSKPAEQAKESYLRMVNGAINSIKRKKWGKVVLSRCKHVATQKNPWEIFKALSDQYPEASVYLFTHPESGTWLGASPEVLLNYSPNKLETMSLAGTIPSDHSRDFSDKEREEQQMVTDYIFEQLHNESQLSEIAVGQAGPQSSGPVIHLKTSLSAKPAVNFGPAKLLNSLHPTPAVCGFPKEETREYIKRCETYSRSYYTGYFGFRNATTGSYWVNLRCLQLFADAGVVYAGGGITAKSDPESEWEETNSKMRTIIDVL